MRPTMVEPVRWWRYRYHWRWHRLTYVSSPLVVIIGSRHDRPGVKAPGLSFCYRTAGNSTDGRPRRSTAATKLPRASANCKSARLEHVPHQEEAGQLEAIGQVLGRRRRLGARSGTAEDAAGDPPRDAPLRVTPHGRFAARRNVRSSSTAGHRTLRQVEPEAEFAQQRQLEPDHLRAGVARHRAGQPSTSSSAA